jgi:hypothetical protein
MKMFQSSCEYTKQYCPDQCRAYIKSQILESAHAAVYGSHLEKQKPLCHLTISMISALHAEVEGNDRRPFIANMETIGPEF